MAKAASDRGAQAIFLTPTNAIGCTGSTAQTNTRGQYPAATIAAGASAGVPVIDVTTLSAALYTSSGLCPNSNDYTSTTSKVGQFFCGDHTHFERPAPSRSVKWSARRSKTRELGWRRISSTRSLFRTVEQMARAARITTTLRLGGFFPMKTLFSQILAGAVCAHRLFDPGLWLQR